MLSDLQIEIAHTVADVVGPAGFALAGGGALIVHQVSDRVTRDLDYFAPDPTVVSPTAEGVERHLRQAGLAVTRRVEADGFIRLEVRKGDRVCEVDLGHDARRWPAVDQPGLGPVIALEELGADKTLALVGRAEVRDFLDVRALEAILGFDRLCELAADKDLGFTRSHLADAMDRIARFGRDQFEMDDQARRELFDWARDRARALRVLDKTIGPDRDDLGRDRDHGRGIDL